jgi:hypothetical protein
VGPTKLVGVGLDSSICLTWLSLSLMSRFTIVGALIYTQLYESIDTCPSIHEYLETTKLANVEINEVIIAVLLSITPLLEK